MVDVKNNDNQSGSLWLRLKNLRPRLRSHVLIHRHFYRDELWYVLEDQLTGKYHRFTPEAHQIIGLMDGHRCLQDILEEVNSDSIEPAVEEENICWILQQLQVADLLQSEISTNTDELLERYQRKRSMLRFAKFRSPLFLKFLWLVFLLGHP